MCFRRNLLFALAASFLLVYCVSLPASAQSAKTTEIPVGTAIKVRITDSLNSGKSHVGDIFHGTLEEVIMVNSKQLFPRGANVTGSVVAVHPSGRLSDPGELTLTLNTLSSGNLATSVSVEPLQIKGVSHAKSNAAKIGGGSVLGAVIGGLAGGGKGAAIGAGAGAAAGTGVAAATGKREAIVESEALLDFVTAERSSAYAAPAANSSTPETAAKATSSPAPSNAAPASNATSGQASATDTSFDNAVLFTARDRRVIRNCLSQNASELPAGTVTREELPSGSERQVRVGGTLSVDLQKRAQSLPLACEEQLPRLPKDQERVVYSGRVLLIDSSNRILDMFNLDESN